MAIKSLQFLQTICLLSSCCLASNLLERLEQNEEECSNLDPPDLTVTPFCDEEPCHFPFNSNLTIKMQFEPEQDVSKPVFIMGEKVTYAATYDAKHKVTVMTPRKARDTTSKQNMCTGDNALHCPLKANQMYTYSYTHVLLANRTNEYCISDTYKLDLKLYIIDDKKKLQQIACFNFLVDVP